MTSRISAGVGQMSASMTGRPSSPVPSGSVVRSMSTAPGEREGDDQRRRGEVRGPHQRVDPALEVAVARQHGRDDELVGLDRLRDRLGERAGVADARRAAVAGEREAERRERPHQAGLLEVAGHGLGSRRQRGLDGGRDRAARGRRRCGPAARRRP